MEEGRKDAGRKRCDEGDAHEQRMTRGMRYCRSSWEVMVKERKQGI